MSKEFKKIGSNIDLKGIVLHQVKKDAGFRTASIKYATGELNIGEKEKVFIAKIYKAYFDNSKPIYGIFGNQDMTFKNDLALYMKDNHLFKFSKNASDHYKKTLASSAPSTGGFLIFAHFENTEKKYEYMLVMTITNKDGFVVKESDLSLEDIKNLDLSKIDVACMINLSKWQEIEGGKDQESKTYLSFAKGAKDVSYYFMSFIDCDNKTTKTESTNRLIKAVDEYCNERGYSREEKIRKRNEIFVYCSECLDNKKEILLSSISAIMQPENTSDFEEFAAAERYGVSSIINGDKSKLKPMKFVTYKDNNMTVEFDPSLIQEGKVVYDSKKNQLTFRNIPEKLAIQIP